MLYLLAPWTAINLVDYFLVRRGYFDIAEILNPHSAYGQWAWRGLAACTLGVAAEIPFMVLTFYEGPAARALGGVDVAFVVALTVAGIAFLLLGRTNQTVTSDTLAPSLKGVR
jgi:NCS1 family nucleobase:cation symporter-1